MSGWTNHSSGTSSRSALMLNGPFLTMMLMISYSASAAAIVVCSAFVSYAGYNKFSGQYEVFSWKNRKGRFHPVRWVGGGHTHSDLDDVGSDEVEPIQPSQNCPELSCRPATRLRGAGSRRD